MDTNQTLSVKPKSHKGLINIIGLILVLLPVVNLLVFNPCNTRTENINSVIIYILFYISIFFFFTGLILGIYYVIKKQKGTLAMQLIIWGAILFIVNGLLVASVFCPMKNGAI